MCPGRIVPSSLDAMELVSGSVVISRNGVLVRSETQAHPYQGWTTIVVQCKQFPVKYPLFSPFSALQVVWRNPIFFLQIRSLEPYFFDYIAFREI